MINRLIIVGNGFDIAHGLKTKYSDFVEDYYSKLKNSGDWKDEFFSCNNHGFVISGHSNLTEIIEQLEKSQHVRHSYRDNKIHFDKNLVIEVKNSFFYKISKKHSIQNWVDIENEYFKALLDIIDSNKRLERPKDFTETQILKEITKLNYEMDAVAVKFEKYLVECVIPTLDKTNLPIENLLNDRVHTESNDLSNFAKEFPRRYTDNNDFFNNRSYKVDFTSKFNSTLVLNFNYTSTFLDLYRFSLDKLDTINIHGSVNSKNNPINLGFGDEMSKRYGEIEDLNENEYLRLMKSFAYSNNDNYKKLFDFIESGDFQVQTMGHSCGTSDRTLLNAIFENHNCKSIKVFYHEYEDKDGNKHNNYSDIVRNISRHFNQKAMMRDKIVNKEYTRPLIS